MHGIRGSDFSNVSLYGVTESNGMSFVSLMIKKFKKLGVVII